MLQSQRKDAEKNKKKCGKKKRKKKKKTSKDLVARIIFKRARGFWDLSLILLLYFLPPEKEKTHFPGGPFSFLSSALKKKSHAVLALSRQ